ncbi:MAG TPA: SulP family inorganic anion transporter [Candidatus Binataceae bacterium]
MLPRTVKSTDLLAGLAIAAVEIPTALAYAELAGFPPVVGLYASILPLVAYALFGSSPQLIVGPDAATCALVAASLAPVAMGNSLRHLELSITLSVVVGSLCVVGGLLRLGGLANFLSRPILVGFLNGMGLVIISGQLGKLFGLHVRTDTGFFLRIADFVSKIGQTHFPTLIVGVLTLVLIYLVGRVAPRVPGPLVGVCGGIAMMVLLDSEKWPVARMGAVPAGFSLPHFHRGFFSDAAQIIPDAVGIALISFCSSMITAKSFAVRNGYEVQADREFIALGIANIASGLSSGFPIAGADSRTAINDLTGGRSQASGLTAATIMALVLVGCTAPLAYIPNASLGAVLVLAGVSLFDFQTLRRIWGISRAEFVLSAVATLGVATIGVLPGIALAIALSVALLLVRASSPHDAILGQVPGVDGFTDISEYDGAQTIPGVLIYRFDAALLFFNADYFKQRVRRAVARSAQPVRLFIFDMEAISVIDITGLDALEEVRSELASKGMSFVVARAKAELREHLVRAGSWDRIGAKNFHPSVRSAVQFALKNEPELRTFRQDTLPSPRRPTG